MLRIGSVLGLTVLLSGCISELTQGPPQPWSATFPDIAVAPDDLVRVVTPFASPRVVTTSTAEIEQSQNVLYVLTSDHDPITMFITDSADESSSINLALTPRAGGAREVDLAEMTDRAIEAPARSKAEERVPSGKVRGVSKEAEETAAWGRPCRMCRDQDDEDDSYDGESRW
ncbi:MAG: hypothetical protein OEU92_26930 [Alphaproteobacteria bacterium]|nr:hypothetical protein [Alphaproteobacteria bacterium]